jgi:hypothetical protein
MGFALVLFGKTEKFLSAARGTGSFGKAAAIGGL